MEQMMWDSIVKINLSLIGVIENLLVCIAIWRDRKLHNCNNILIANMATADFLQCIDNLAYAYTFSENINMEFYVCAILHQLNPLTAYVSRILFVCVTVERYIVVKWPHKHRKYAKVHIAMCVTWLACLLSACFVFFPALGWGNLKDTYDKKCTILGVTNFSYLFYINTLCLYLLPAIVILFLYTQIIIQLKKNKRRERRFTCNLPIFSENDKRIQKKIKMLTIVIACYFSLHLPIHVYDTVHYLTGGNPPWTQNLDAIFRHVRVINCFSLPVIKPFIYGSQITIRKGIFSLVLCENKPTRHSRNTAKKKQKIRFLNKEIGPQKEYRSSKTTQQKTRKVKIIETPKINISNDNEKEFSTASTECPSEATITELEPSRPIKSPQENINIPKKSNAANLKKGFSELQSP